MKTALARGGVDPAEVDYLEAHGSGSGFGDPIEVQAAAAVYGKGREADRPLLIGSVKTNIGHLEPAAGIASLIKTALAMKRGVIPKNLHFRGSEPALGLGSASGAGGVGHDRLAEPSRTAAARGGECLWDFGDELSRCGGRVSCRF